VPHVKALSPLVGVSRCVPLNRWSGHGPAGLLLAYAENCFTSIPTIVCGNGITRLQDGAMTIAYKDV